MTRLEQLYEGMVKKGLLSSKKDFSEKFGFAYANLARYLNGQLKTTIDSENYRKFVDAGVNINWLLTGEGEMFQGKKEEVATVPHKVPLLRQTVSCGPGQDWLDKDAIDSYIEPLDLIPKEAGAEIFAFRVKGTSMVGAGINDGDVVLFDARKGRDVSDDLYVFALDGSVYCKLLKFDSISQKIHIYSLHTSEVEKAELLRSLDANDADAMDTFHLFGRVMAWIRENRVVRR